MNSPQQTFDRIRSVAWRESPDVNRCSASKAHLLLEYMRRAALWARETGAPAPGRWPVYDIAGTAHPSVTVGAGLRERVEEWLQENVSWPGTEDLCLYAVRFAALRETPGIELPNPPDPFEPLFALWDRGGELILDETGGALFGGRSSTP